MSLHAGRGHVGTMDWRAATRIDHAQIILQSEDAPMTFPGTMFHCAPQFSRTAAPRSGATGRRRGRIALPGLAVLGLAVAAAALATRAVPPASAQFTPPPADQATSPTVACRPAGGDLIMPPEIVSSGGVLKGIVTLTEEFQRLPPTAAGSTNCAQQLLRAFRPGIPLPAPNALLDPVPGPTLRAKVGELVQLSFVNLVDANRFDRNVVMGADGCMQVGQGGSTYPGGPPGFDKFPNCLHASSTANIHYHGTHTSPNATGDNVFLEIIPLPRDNQGNLTTTPEQAMAGLEPFFQQCALQLRNPLNQWPAIWKDLTNNAWLAKQKELLMDYQNKNPGQPVWDADMTADTDGSWPQYYMGAVPYCFALPAYTAGVFPPPPGSSSPIMGQAPGTHWYHAHKHGSTAINVINGMTGAFIIEGQYDADLNAFYGGYVLKGGAWNARSQPVLVLNQLGTTPNLLSGGNGPAGPAGVPFVVNGLSRPIAHMQPGEVQLWRIVNTSARNAAYFMAPEGFQWRQLAQDGVQFAQPTYASPQNQNRPFYLAPANRVDLLVQAPMTPVDADVLIQGVMARTEVKPTPLNANEPKVGAVLMSVSVSGAPVTRNGEPAQMPFPPQGRAPVQPKFLTDITDAEWRRGGSLTKEFTFDSKGPASAMQHTINGIQFEDGAAANVLVRLGNVEEWKIVNTTVAPGPIDHPFHIHVNPFQIREVFDPNENLVDPDTGKLEAQLVNGKTLPVPRYVIKGNPLSTNPDFAKRQCVLDPDNPATWSVAGACGPQTTPPNLIWWDVFAIPSARAVPNTAIVIPGYFKMRSRFVDYHGDYVMHCHILVHEDRGMMFTVEVIPEKQLAAGHHH
jgi:FtsP/CotA-like multicopper oxidase with cupredoxin domain